MRPPSHPEKASAITEIADSHCGVVVSTPRERIHRLIRYSTTTARFMLMCVTAMPLTPFGKDSKFGRFSPVAAVHLVPLPVVGPRIQRVVYRGWSLRSVSRMRTAATEPEANVNAATSHIALVTPNASATSPDSNAPTA